MSDDLNTAMPECQNCGSFVTAAYARVFTPNGIDEPRVCPQCEDKIRDEQRAVELFESARETVENAVN